MKADGIRDEETLRAWLMGRPEGERRKVAVTIALRSACRLAPDGWNNPGPHVGPIGGVATDVTTLPINRALLSSGVLAKNPTEPLLRATKSAALAAYSASSTTADYPVAYKAHMTAHAAALVADQVALLSGDSGDIDRLVWTVRACNSGPTMWEQYAQDAVNAHEGDPLAKPLWTSGIPDGFRLTSIEFRKLWEADPAYSFWLRWWEGVLSGNQIDWALQEAVALIPDEVWQAGPEAVAAEIARVELDFLVAASPNAEDIIINTEGKYEAVPRSDLPARTLNDARNRIADTIRLIRNSDRQNQHAALMSEADLLEDTLQRHGDNPLRLYEVCAKVVRHVGVNVAQGVLPENDNVVSDVRGDMQDTADDIYSFDSEVRKTVDARRKMRFTRLDETQKTRIAELAEAVAEHSVPALAAELREDATVVLGEAQPTDDTRASWARLGSRLVRVVALGGKMFMDVAEALGWLGGVAGGIVAFKALLVWLLGLLL